MTLKERLAWIDAVFGEMVDNEAKLSPESRRALETGINKALGQALGFLAEYYQIQKAQKKGREVVVQTYGDVSVGKNSGLGTQDAFAKTIECKSVSTDTPASVKAQLQKAFKQLAGMTGHTPRAGDARVVELMINFKNPWPYPSEIKTIPAIDDWRQRAIAAIEDALTSSPGHPALDQWLLATAPGPVVQIGQLKDVNKGTPKSHRPVHLSDGKMTLPNVLKVRVSWPSGSPTAHDGNSLISLESFSYWRYASGQAPPLALSCSWRITKFEPTKSVPHVDRYLFDTFLNLDALDKMQQ